MRIVVDPRQRIAEYGESFLERHAVLPKVRGGLLWVPRKSRRHHTKAYHPTIRGRLPDGLTLPLSRGGRKPRWIHPRTCRPPSAAAGCWAAWRLRLNHQTPLLTMAQATEF